MFEAGPGHGVGGEYAPTIKLDHSVRVDHLWQRKGKRAFEAEQQARNN